jgi:hypothetical protein
MYWFFFAFAYDIVALFVFTFYNKITYITR